MLNPSYLLVLLLALAAPGVIRGQQEPTASLRQGRVTGSLIYLVEQRREVSAFLGLPYALPPTGDRRFQPPLPHLGWNRTLVATEFGPPCPQLGREFRSNEDCLTLNIWAPQAPRFSTGRVDYPVLVVLAGEFFETGDTSRFPAQDIAGFDVVVVTVNYRLNVFGFLSTEDSSAPGNLGLLDQLMALEWVTSNIEAFGGNPRSITLLGHSAGAASAMHHFLSGRSTRLFSRMILMSGTALAPWALSKQPRDFAMDLGRRLSCQTETSVSLLRCLRERDANEILVAFGRQKMASSDLPANGAMYGPVVDKFLPPAQQMVPEDPHESLMKATVPRIPVIIGGTGDEGVIALYYYNGIPQGTFAEIKAFFVNSAIPQMLRQYGFVDQLPAAADRGSSNVLVLRELLEYLYVQRVAQGDKAGLLRMLVKFFGDAFFHAPTAATINLLSQAGRDAPVYVYRYNFLSNIDAYGNTVNFTGAAHGTDFLHLFSPAMYAATQPPGSQPTFMERSITGRLQTRWTEFAKAGLNLWERHDPQDPQMYSLEGGQMIPSLGQRELTLWSDLLPMVAQMGKTDSPWVPGGPEPTAKPSKPGHPDPTEPYQSVMWGLTVCCVLLLALLVICAVCLRQSHTARKKQFPFGHTNWPHY